MMPCIYCKLEKKKTDEHIIHYAFIKTRARFVVLKEAVCDDCNKKLGKEIDLYFAQDTIEGITRYKQGIKSRDTPRPQRAISIKLLDDAALFGQWAGAYGWINGATGNFHPHNQIQIFNRETGERKLVLESNELDLLKGTQWLDEKNKLDFKILVNGENGEESEKFLEKYKNKLKECGISFAKNKTSEFTAPDSLLNAKTVAVDLSNKISTRTIRAYAKILFNYVAKYKSISEVMKDEWDEARNFILNGTGTLKYSLEYTSFWGQESADRRLFFYGAPGFNVKIEMENGDIVGFIQFYNLVTYKICLVKKSSSQISMAGVFTKKGYYSGINIPPGFFNILTDHYGRLTGKYGEGYSIGRFSTPSPSPPRSPRDEFAGTYPRA